MHADLGSPPDTGPLSRTESDFAAEISTFVWLGSFTDPMARSVLRAYARACRRWPPDQALLSTALVREYCRCRERQDLCS
jgi:hypothetical protein